MDERKDVNFTYSNTVTMIKSWIWISAVIILLLQTKADITDPPACNVFCRGKILEVVQNSNLYVDCKTFVDMKMRIPEKEIRVLFDQMMRASNGKPERVLVRRFVRHCFTSGNEFERHHPVDWVESPKILSYIRDRHLKKWAEDLNILWKRLGRKVSADVRYNQDMHSIVYVPNLVVIPGGRYREYSYWDSYWIILGLLRSEMFQTSKGMIKNYLFLTKKFGYVPSGGRIYFLKRSNPPLLIPMVYEYYKFTKDYDFIAESIGTLEKEFKFWLEKRVVNVKVNGVTHKLARYDNDGTGPRPEAYRADVQVARSIKSPEKKLEFYRNLRSACESGWHFSSRWFVNNTKTNGNLKNTNPRFILPVDLNAILCLNARILSKFFGMLGASDKSSSYDQIAVEMQTSLTTVMWNETDGIWYDYDMLSKTSRTRYYASNVVPLWAKCYGKEREDIVGDKVTKYLKNIQIDSYTGGIPVSFEKTKLDWDFPSSFPPLQHLIITGLRLTKNKQAEALAFELATSWLKSTYKSYMFTKAMFNKYNSQKSPVPRNTKSWDGHVGYGWTNGVCLDLLQIYGRKIYVFGENAASRYVLPSIATQITIGIFMIFS